MRYSSHTAHGATSIVIGPPRVVGGNYHMRTMRVTFDDGHSAEFDFFGDKPIPVHINSDVPYDPRADEANERGIIDAQTLEESEA